LLIVVRWSSSESWQAPDLGRYELAPAFFAFELYKRYASGVTNAIHPILYLFLRLSLSGYVGKIRRPWREQRTALEKKNDLKEKAGEEVGVV